jgi:hypothetical protein
MNTFNYAIKVVIVDMGILDWIFKPIELADRLMKLIGFGILALGGGMMFIAAFFVPTDDILMNILLAILGLAGLLWFGAGVYDAITGH